MAEEKQFEEKVKWHLKTHGAWFIKYWAGAQYTKKGIPDILVCYEGSFVALEVKATHGRPTLLQLVNLARIRDAGGYGLLLYPQDFDEFKVFLDNRHPNHDFYLRNIERQFHWKQKLLKEETDGSDIRKRRSPNRRSIHDQGRQHSRLGAEKDSGRRRRARQIDSDRRESDRAAQRAD